MSDSNTLPENVSTYKGKNYNIDECISALKFMYDNGYIDGVWCDCVGKSKFFYYYALENELYFMQQSKYL